MMLKLKYYQLLIMLVIFLKPHIVQCNNDTSKYEDTTGDSSATQDDMNSTDKGKQQKEGDVCPTKQLPEEYLGTSIVDHLDPSLLEDEELLKEAAQHLQQGHLVVIQDAFKVEFAESAWSIMTDPVLEWEPFVVTKKDGHNFFKHKPVKKCNESMLGVEKIFEHSDSRKFLANLLYGDGVPSIAGRNDPQENLDGEFVALPSWYRPGDHSNPHNDRMADRKLTYLWQLAKDWKPEWGGAFYWASAYTTNAFQHPTFNTLLLFAVTPHSDHGVTPVTQASEGHRRLTFGGWYYKTPKQITWDEPLEEMYNTPEKRRSMTLQEAKQLYHLPTDDLDENRKQVALDLREKVLDCCLAPQEEEQVYTIGYLDESDTDDENDEELFEEK